MNRDRTIIQRLKHYSTSRLINISLINENFQIYQEYGYNSIRGQNVCICIYLTIYILINK